MSYNVSTITIISQDGFHVDPDVLESFDREMAPCNWDGADPFYWHKGPAGVYPYKDIFPWHGEGSGTTWEHLIEDLLPQFRGMAEMLVCWEEGDYYSGIRVYNGKVTEHEMIFRLGERKQ